MTTAFLSLLLAITAAQDSGADRATGFRCAVVPTMRAAEVKKSFLSENPKSDPGIEGRWVVKNDEIATYYFLRDDPALRFYSERRELALRLQKALESKKAVALDDLPDAMQGKALAALRKLGPLPEDPKQVLLGISVAEHFEFENSGRHVMGDLRATFAEPPPLDPRTIPQKQGGDDAPMGPLLSELALDDLTLLVFGGQRSHRSQAVLAEHAFKQYADLVKELQDGAEEAAKSLFSSACAAQGLQLLPYEPKSGDQLDEKRRQALLARGIASNRSDGVDASWLKSCRISDHYFVITFFATYSDEAGNVVRQTEYGLPVRLKG